MLTRRELNHLILDVELVLISVVQGVALTTLAIEAAPILREHHAVGYAFVGSGLLFVLSFWAAALIHAVSFVAWPMDLVHYFFYFGLALLECLTFGQMERPRDWFGYSVACYVVSWALYLYDYALMRSRSAMFEASESRRHLFAHILAQQRLEMLALIPAGLLFNGVAYGVVCAHPGTAPVLAWTQLVFTLLFLASLVRNFSRRQRLITDSAD